MGAVPAPLTSSHRGPWRWALAAGLAIGLLVAAFVLPGLTNGRGRLVGGVDYIAYWAGFDVAMEGGDPYDPDQILRAQQVMQPSRGVPQVYLNPPWTLLVLAPVLALPFEVSVAAWFVLSCAAAVAVARLCWRLLRPTVNGPPMVLVAAALVFLPVAEGLRIGQLGLFIALVTLGGLVAMREGRDVTAGALFGLVIVKPQAVLLVLVVVAIHGLAAGRWRMLAAALVSAGFTVGASVVVLPDVWAAWDVASLPSSAHSATLAGVVRTVVVDLTGQDTRLPIVIVPLMAVLLMVPWAIRHRHQMPWNALPILVAVSALAAPHAWVYDGATLLLIQVAAVAVWLEGRRGGTVVVLVAVAIQAAAFWLTTFQWADHRHLIVVPAAMLALAIWMYERGDCAADPDLSAV